MTDDSLLRTGADPLLPLMNVCFADV